MELNRLEILEQLDKESLIKEIDRLQREQTFMGIVTIAMYVFIVCALIVLL